MAQVGAQVRQIVTDQTVTCHDGTVIAMRADSVCLHGDTPGAVDMAREVRAALDAAGVAVSSGG